MNRSMHAVHAVGSAAVVLRASDYLELALGHGWQPTSASCNTNGFAMNASTKRSPRRLGKRST